MSHDITPVSATHRHGAWNTEEYLEIFLGFVDTGDVPDTGVICDESSLSLETYVHTRLPQICPHGTDSICGKIRPSTTGSSRVTVTVLFCLVVGTDVSTFPVTALLDHTRK